MRRKLDLELENRKITNSRMKEIKRRMLEEYGIDIMRLLDVDNTVPIWTDIYAKIAQRCLDTVDYRGISLEKIPYQRMEYAKMGFSIPHEQIIITKMEPSENNHFNEDDKYIDSNLDKEAILKLYDAISKPDDIHMFIVELSLDEWKQQMNHIVEMGKIFELDFEAQNCFQLKYTLICDKTYNLFEEKITEPVNPYDRLTNEDYFPMSNPYQLPKFIKGLQNILFTQKYIRVFDFKAMERDNIRNNIVHENKSIESNTDDSAEKSKESVDITRYSFTYVKQIYEMLTNSELENLYYLDNTLGISLTNTIFHYTINRPWPEWSSEEHQEITINPEIFDGNLFDIVSILGKLEFTYGRNYIAQMTFNFLWQHNFSRKIVDSVFQYLKENISKYNNYYRDLQEIRIWQDFYNIEEWTEDEKNQYVEDFEHEWRDSFESYIYDERIGKIMDKNKSNKDDRVKRGKIIKKPETLYAHLHEAVMKGIWVK